MNSSMQTQYLACIIVSCVYCKAVANTINRDINAEFEICMLTILRRSLNYYKGHRTTMAPLLSDVPPLAIINKAYPSFRPLSRLLSTENRIDYSQETLLYRYCYRRETQTLLLVEKSLSLFIGNIKRQFYSPFNSLSCYYRTRK